MWYTWIGHLSQNLWPFEFLESFRCSILSVSAYYAPESDMHLNCFDHMNFKTASVVQFRSCRYITRLNLTSVWKVMAIWISQELQFFNFVCVDILRAWIWPPCEQLWQFEFLESFRCSISSESICDAPESDLRVKSSDNLNFSRVTVVQFWGSWYVVRLNRTSESKVMTIWIFWELPLSNFERLDILCAWIWLPCEKLWQLEFVESFCCLISSISICDSPESDIRVKSCDHLNFPRASVVQFRASRYVMRLNRTSELKVMTIWISWELTLFILSVSICDALELDSRVKNYDHLNFSRASVVHFERLNMWCAWIGHPS